jgi:hypothetical protein
METSKDFTFKNYSVKDKVATPDVGNPYLFSSTKSSDEFEQWKQSHTYATDCKEDGVYPKECFGESVTHANKTHGWFPIPSVETEYYESRGYKTRHFLPFKQPSKQAGVETVINAEIASKEAVECFNRRLLGDKDGAYYLGFLDARNWQSTQSYSPSEVEAIVKEVIKRATIASLQTGNGMIYKDVQYTDLLNK